MLMMAGWLVICFVCEFLGKAASAAGCYINLAFILIDFSSNKVLVLVCYEKKRNICLHHRVYVCWMF